MSKDFSIRCELPELMDDPHLSKEALEGTLKDISRCNRLLGGNKITLNAVNQFFNQYPDKKEWIIVDMGCGDGEMLRLISDKFENQNVSLQLIGVDLSPKNVFLAREKSMDYEHISFIEEDILKLNPDHFKCDIILCTLTLHHFSDTQILIFLKQFVRLAARSILINDLQRSKLSYQLFRIFSSIFIKSPVAKYDGLISIRSSFRRNDFKKFAKELKIADSRVSWKWAFRYLWTIKTL